MYNSLLNMIESKALDQKIFLHIWNRSANKLEFSYSDVYKGAQKYASYLRYIGLKKEERVAILLLTRIEFFYSFFGVIIAGGIPIPLHPPMFILEWNDYKEKFLHIISKSNPKYIICYEEIFNTVKNKLLPNSLYKIITCEDIQSSGDIQISNVSENGIAYIQYTSGTTALPKGCIITNNALMNNIRAIGERVEFDKNDTFVSWLPLYHDMGLIGFLCAYYFSIPICLLPTEYFVMQPTMFFKIISDYKATIIYAPNFGYVICNKYVNHKKMNGVDLSSLRLSLIGAEHIEKNDLLEFINNFKQYRFNENTFFPVYGFAESCLAVSFPMLNEVMEFDCIDWEKLNISNKAITVPYYRTKTLYNICVGKPIGDHKIKIINENGHEVEEGTIGEICVKSNMIIKEYDNSNSNSNIFTHDGFILTNDIGYLKNGNLYYFERKNNIIQKNGIKFRPKEFEHLCWNIVEIKRGRSALLINNESNNIKLELVIETGTYYQDKYIEIIEKLNNLLLENIGNIPDYVRVVARGCIPETSSGKKQYYLCKEKIINGLIDTHFLYDNISKTILYCK